jgi:hypothetical protein
LESHPGLGRSGKKWQIYLKAFRRICVISRPHPNATKHDEKKHHAVWRDRCRLVVLRLQLACLTYSIPLCMG